MNEKDYRKRIYENYASNFQDTDLVFSEKKSIKWGRAYNFYFKNWLPSDKNSKILEVACGGGKLLHFFKMHGYENITGIDISPEQVQISKQVIPNVIEHDVLDYLEKTEEKYDLIVGLDIVEHFHKAEVLQFLDACFKSLNPNGRIILKTPNAESPWGSVHRYNDFTHEVGFNPNLLNRLLALSGFESAEARESGPIAIGYSILSTFRYILWQTIRSFLKVWNLAEKGGIGSGVYTSIFLISAVKK